MTRPVRLIIPITAPYLTLRYGAFSGPADLPILDFNAPQHALLTGFARFSSVPRARIGMMSRITTRGLPHGDRHIPARPNGYHRGTHALTCAIATVWCLQRALDGVQEAALIRSVGRFVPPGRGVRWPSRLAHGRTRSLRRGFAGFLAYRSNPATPTAQLPASITLMWAARVRKSCGRAS